MKEELGAGGGNAVAVGGILAVADHEIDALELFEGRKMGAEEPAADAADHVADGKNVHGNLQSQIAGIGLRELGSFLTGAAENSMLAPRPRATRKFRPPFQRARRAGSTRISAGLRCRSGRCPIVCHWHTAPEPAGETRRVSKGQSPWSLVATSEIFCLVSAF